MLFEPESLTVRLAELQLEESCPFVKPGSIRFHTVPALIITGGVRPPVADVAVKVTLRQPDSKVYVSLVTILLYNTVVCDFESTGTVNSRYK